MPDIELQEAANGEASEFADRSIRCVDCNEQFVWTVGEQVFFHDKGLKNEPSLMFVLVSIAKNDRLAAISASQVAGTKQKN